MRPGKRILKVPILPSKEWGCLIGEGPFDDINCIDNIVPQKSFEYHYDHLNTVHRHFVYKLQKSPHKNEQPFQLLVDSLIKLFSRRSALYWNHRHFQSSHNMCEIDNPQGPSKIGIKIGIHEPVADYTKSSAPYGQ